MYVAVCAIISANLGKVFIDCKHEAYTTEAIIRVLRSMRSHLGRGYKYALFMDNASIHNNEDVKTWCSEKQIPIIWNSPYRPDLNGIE